MAQSAELSRYLARGMDAALHWFPRDVPAARLAAVIVGMANTPGLPHGGTVLVGIAPRSAHIQGIGDPADILNIVFQAALMADPPLVLPLPRILSAGSQQVLQIHVPTGLPHVYNLEGRYLWREGTQTNPIPARQLRQLLLERGAVQFETQPAPGASSSDLDFDKVADYAHRLDFPGVDEFNRSEALAETLARRGCLTSDLQPTYAALALFGRNPQRWLPGCLILAARFSGTSFTDQYIQQEISGTLPEQLRQAEIFVRESLPSRVRLTGLAHQENPEYPLEAVRELLVNAVAHRDYNLQGDMIHLNIFSDRLEVHSPGGLPGPVTLENLLEARFSRNAVIVQVLADLGFIERLGYGLDRVVRAMRKFGLRPPLFQEVAGSFRVTLFAAPQRDAAQDTTQPVNYRDLNLNPRQEAALDYLARQRRITNRDYQDLCPDVHPETLRRDLAELVSRGLLIKVGDKKATYYILK